MRRDFPPGGPLEDPDAEVQDEIRFHLEARAQELIRSGMEEEEAWRRARDAFGDVGRIEDEVRRLRRERERERGWTMRMGAWIGDLRMAVRGFRRRPGFSAVIVATLALGIGAVTAIFTVVNAALIRALPFDDADRLVFLQGAFNAPEGPQVRGGSPPEVREWGEMSRSFEAVGAFSGITSTLTGSDTPAERIQGERIDRGYFQILAGEPIRGRTFTAEEYESYGPGPALIGEGLWTRRFGRDDGVLGRTVELDGSRYTVVGVLPDDFPGATLEAEIWVPLASTLSDGGLESRASRWLGAVARLSPGVDRDAAQVDMNAVTARLEEQLPEENLDRIALVTPLREVYLDTSGPLILILFGATGLLLIIAAVNVANLLMVRASGRTTETFVRRALGAGRGALVRQSLTESFLYTLVGAGLGLVVGIRGAGWLADAAPDAILPGYVEVAPDATVLLVVVGVMTIVAVGVGVAPALFTRGVDLATGLRSGGDGERATGGARIRNALVAGEVGLALLLLVGAGLMVRSLQAQLAVESGFDHDELVTFVAELPSTRWDSPEARRAGAFQLGQRLREVPGVTDVTWGPDAAPLRGGFSAAYLWTNAGGGVDDRVRFYIHQVEPGWFETMGVRIDAGRPLEPADAEGPPSTAVISQAFADRHYPGEDPVGRTLYVGDPADGPQLTIVGVANDVRYRDLTTDLVAGPTDPDIWIPWTAGSGGLEYVVRTDRHPAATLSDIRSAVEAFDPDMPPQSLQPMSDLLRGQTAQRRFGSMLLGLFSVLAATLAAVGLYGVLSFTVGRRTREIAIRMAMGADRGQVLRMVVLDGLKLAGLGLAAGAVVAAFASRSLASFLYGVEPVDLATYAGVAALMATVAGIAAWIPALRATRIDPQRALAGE